MKKNYLSIIIAGIFSSFVGCATTEPPKNLVDIPTDPSSSVQEVKEPKELTLTQAVALTLEKSPELKSFSKAVRVGEARALQAGLMPNPELSVSVEDAFGPHGKDSYSQLTLQLSQIVELGGKRGARIDQAEAFQKQLNSDYEIKRVEVLTNVTDKFIRTVANEHLVRLSKKAAEIAKRSLKNIQERAKAGGVSEVEEAKARVLVARAHIESEHAEHELLSSKRELSAFWGVETPTFNKINADLFQDTSLPTFEDLSARIDVSPEIRRWVTEKRLREAEQKLAKAKSIPDLTIGAGPRRLEQTNEDSWVFQVSLPLNIFDRNQGGREEAEILSKKAVVDEEVSRLRLKTTLFTLYQEANHFRTQLDAMKKEIVPQAERALHVAQAGYEKGSLSYLEYFDAQKTLVEVLRENIEAAYQFHSLINSIERLLGAPLAEGAK